VRWRRESSIRISATVAGTDAGADGCPVQLLRRRGKDADFGKPKPAYKIDAPPFYAALVDADHPRFADGPQDHTKCQVVDLHGRVIDGLFAAARRRAASLFTACRGSPYSAALRGERRRTPRAPERVRVESTPEHTPAWKPSVNSVLENLRTRGPYVSRRDTTARLVSFAFSFRALPA